MIFVPHAYSLIKLLILSNLNRSHRYCPGRDDRIFTFSILYPALHPFSKLFDSVIVKNPCLVFHIVIFSSIYIQYLSLAILLFGLNIIYYYAVEIFNFYNTYYFVLNLNWLVIKICSFIISREKWEGMKPV